MTVNVLDRGHYAMGLNCRCLLPLCAALIGSDRTRELMPTMTARNNLPKTSQRGFKWVGASIQQHVRYGRSPADDAMSVLYSLVPKASRAKMANEFRDLCLDIMG